MNQLHKKTNETFPNNSRMLDECCYLDMETLEVLEGPPNPRRGLQWSVTSCVIKTPKPVGNGHR